MIRRVIKRFVEDEKGQALVEYSILLSIAAFVVLSVLTVSGQKIQNSFSAASNQMVVAGQPVAPVAQAGFGKLPTLNFGKVKTAEVKENQNEVLR